MGRLWKTTAHMAARSSDAWFEPPRGQRPQAGLLPDPLNQLQPGAARHLEIGKHHRREREPDPILKSVQAEEILLGLRAILHPLKIAVRVSP